MAVPNFVQIGLVVSELQKTAKTFCGTCVDKTNLRKLKSEYGERARVPSFCFSRYVRIRADGVEGSEVDPVSGFSGTNSGSLLNLLSKSTWFSTLKKMSYFMRCMWENCIKLLAIYSRYKFRLNAVEVNLNISLQKL